VRRDAPRRRVYCTFQREPLADWLTQLGVSKSELNVSQRFRTSLSVAPSRLIRNESADLNLDLTGKLFAELDLIGACLNQCVRLNCLLEST
jgi:hypothetical protein